MAVKRRVSGSREKVLEIVSSMRLKEDFIYSLYEQMEGAVKKIEEVHQEMNAHGKRLNACETDINMPGRYLPLRSYHAKIQHCEETMGISYAEMKEFIKAFDDCREELSKAKHGDGRGEPQTRDQYSKEIHG